MRRRFVNARYLVAGLLVIVGVLGMMIGTFLPLERRMMDWTSRFLVGVLTFRADQNTIQLLESATVLFGRHADEFQDMYFLNRPASVGARVTANGTLVGIVSEGGISSSRVRSIASPEARTNVIFERSGIPTELVGKGAGVLEVQLPKGSDVTMGDRVFFADDPTLFIGNVARIRDVASEPFLIVTVLHNINPTTIFRVDVHDR